MNDGNFALALVVALFFVCLFGVYLLIDKLSR